MPLCTREHMECSRLPTVIQVVFLVGALVLHPFFCVGQILVFLFLYPLLVINYPIIYRICTIYPIVDSLLLFSPTPWPFSGPSQGVILGPPVANEGNHLVSVIQTGLLTNYTCFIFLPFKHFHFC
jgi:hypothetical protein